MTKPIIIISSISETKISDETGKSICEVIFAADQPLQIWKVRVGGNSWAQGIICEQDNVPLPSTELYPSAVLYPLSQISAADEQQTAFIEWDEGLSEGVNEINIYGANSDGEWTDYHT